MFYCLPDTGWATKQLEKLLAEQQELHSLEEDPKLTDVNSNNFNLKEDSKAFLLA